MNDNCLSYQEFTLGKQIELDTAETQGERKSSPPNLFSEQDTDVLGTIPVRQSSVFPEKNCCPSAAFLVRFLLDCLFALGFLPTDGYGHCTPPVQSHSKLLVKVFNFPTSSSAITCKGFFDKKNISPFLKC